MLPIGQIVQQLLAHLGPTLVALLADISDRDLPDAWVTGTTQPRHEAETRLRAGHQAWHLVATPEGETTARAWFTGANPLLEELSPIEALRAGDFDDVLQAAKAFATA